MITVRWHGVIGPRSLFRLSSNIVWRKQTNHTDLQRFRLARVGIGEIFDGEIRAIAQIRMEIAAWRRLVQVLGVGDVATVVKEEIRTFHAGGDGDDGGIIAVARLAQRISGRASPSVEAAADVISLLLPCRGVEINRDCAVGGEESDSVVRGIHIAAFDDAGFHKVVALLEEPVI